MADVFNRAADAFGGSFAADAAKITFVQPGILSSLPAGADPVSGTVGMLTQNLQFNYQQQVTRVYEIGTNLTFLIAGRTQGQAGMGRILGPRPLALAFYQKYGDVCQAATNNLDVEFAASCGNVDIAATQKYSMLLKFCVIISIGATVNSQDMVINETLALLFCSLTMKGVAG